MQVTPQAQAMLTAGDPVKNARAILRNALPINNKPIRKIQSELESISEQLRIPGSKSINPVQRRVSAAKSTLTREEKNIVAAFAADKKDSGMKAIESLKNDLKEFDKVLENGDKQAIPVVQQECLRSVGAIEEALVSKFPFEVLHLQPIPSGHHVFHRWPLTCMALWGVWGLTVCVASRPLCV